ncbi:MAG TPA: glycogen debranching N-terminal domain-containing protein [Candidatus Limnocylindrales bacterium]|nr:glycogen debranching N-terminal domain-containing protein [Candidatus Limnocylindrales bacterium]
MAETLEALADVRFVPVRRPEIVPATDLGSVLVLKHDNLYLLTDQFGDVHPDSRGLGLYEGDTRILSCLALRMNGRRLALLHASATGNYLGTIQLTNPEPIMDLAAKIDAEIPHRSLGIRRDRVLAGSLVERLRVVNYTEEPVALSFELDLAADGADIFEVRGIPRPERGTLLPIAVAERGGRATFRYRGLDGRERWTFVAFDGPVVLTPIEADAGEAGTPPEGSIRAAWRWEMAPGDERVLEWRVWSETLARPVDKVAPGRLFPAPAPLLADEAAAAYHAWIRGTAAVQTDNELFNRTIGRSLADLRLLVNSGPGPDERYVAAGVPWFATLFGRDSIIAALQLLAFRPQLAIETLEVLAARQATEVDDWRDAEPGKILHELRTGEIALAGELPHTPYYGSVDSTPLWLILLGRTFDWTGDRGLVERLWPNALAALRWIDEWGDRDGDGFVEYERRSPRGLRNQGWKDSPDAIRDRLGRLSRPPIALAEVQGYVHEAKLGLARLARLRGETELADRLERDVAALRERFETAFWVDDLRYYAMALDADKRPADAIGSNAGQCLWTGIVRADRARDVVERLMSPMLFSGWGIRTYGAGQPGYNPIGYHTGTVWPHDTSLVAAGLKRYGYHEEANLLIGRIFETAQHFPDFRLPELFCGFDREATPIPVPYPVACSPQAWAAGAPFLFLQTMLGLEAHADRRELELVQPHLPPWVRSVRLTNVRVGDAVVDLLFHSWRGTTSAEVLRKVGDVRVTIRL